MPQVHNPSRLMDSDSSAFGKNSRYMSTMNFTQGSMRRMNALNYLDKRITNIKVRYYDRHERIHVRKMERTRNRMMENLQKRMAYKLVLKSHSIAKAKDYHAALQKNYSLESMQHEVGNMMYMMRPDLVRQNRARALIDNQKRRYDEVIQKNKNNLDRIFPPPKKWEPASMSKFDQNLVQIEEPEPTMTPLPNIERRNRMSLHTLRRRVIALADPKSVPESPDITRLPLSPIKSPAIIKQMSSHSINSPRKQAMTMTMMKKQKSFQETKEKTNLTDSQNNRENIVSNIAEEKHDDTKDNSEEDKDKVDEQDTKDKSEEDKETENNNKDNETQKYTVLPPINKDRNIVSEVHADGTKTNNQEKKGKLPVLKMKKGSR